jgi:hypothetical protein
MRGLHPDTLTGEHLELRGRPAQRIAFWHIVSVVVHPPGSR